MSFFIFLIEHGGHISSLFSFDLLSVATILQLISILPDSDKRIEVIKKASGGYKVILINTR